ncbi:MAG: capsular biosynthesis protein [Bacteroidetes bacterium]|nr:capsular biosynthesis protein [Bacteroidota bacterium]MCH8232613.1 capsular biosynthesis protein [Bacteroidota bacterium]
MIRLFKRKRTKSNPLIVDIHSHLLPGLDDGVSSLDESLEILKKFEKFGYKKVVTTPHIMSDFYRNTPDGISEALQELQHFVKDKTEIIVEAAAEYYLDEGFIELLTEHTDLILCIGNKYILFETSFMSEPVYLKEAIFYIQSNGYKPLMAHPERYQYLHNSWDLTQDLIDRGTLFQININSLAGYYTKPVQKMAIRLIKNDMVHFLGSDCHNMNHWDVTLKAFNTKGFRLATGLPLLNNSLA